MTQELENLSMSYIFGTMSDIQRPLSTREATVPAVDEPSADVKAWQKAKIEAGLKAANEGRFATADAVKEVVRKFIPNG